MAEAKRRDAWSRTSSLMALLANCHRDPKRTRPFAPGYFDPFTHREQEQRADESVGIEILKVFVDGQVP